MTPFHRTLPFQLAWNNQPGGGEDRQPAHAIKISRLAQVKDTGLVVRLVFRQIAFLRFIGHTLHTAGQMIKLLSSFSNRVKQPISKEVKWGFM